MSSQTKATVHSAAKQLTRANVANNNDPTAAIDQAEGCLQRFTPLIMFLFSNKQMARECKGQLGTQRVQALANISCLALWCHSNATSAPTANPPNSAQLGGTPYHSPSYVWLRAVAWACSCRQTHRHTHTHRHVWPLYVLRHLRLTRNVTTL